MTSSFFKKHSRISRSCSIVLAFVMVVNMMFGYSILTETETKEVKAATTANTTPRYRNVMYYGEWSIYAGQKNFTVDKIRGDLITHLNFAFMDVDANGDLLLCDYWADVDNPNVGFSVGTDSTYAGVLGAMVLLRNKYPNMKIGISVGGWTRSGDFPKLAAKESTRKHFAENIAKFVHYYGYDFVDIDWEYPTADRDPDPEGNGVTVDKGCKGSEADSKNFTYMLQDIREQLDKYGAQDEKHYELSVAMSASPAMMAKIEYDKVLDTVDFANMMTYDLNGAWAGYTAHQTALYTNDAYDPDTQADGQFSVDTCIKYLENTYGNSIDYSKIVIGVAPYTRGWAEVQKDGRDSDNPGLYATAAPNSVKAADGTTSGTYAYSDIDELISKYHLKEYYDEKAEAAYYYSDETGYFFTCDNERSVTAKGNYVKEKQLGGLISWMASLDSASAITQVMKESLYGEESLPAQEIKFPAIDNIQTTVEASDNTYTITIKNNNALTESNAAVLLNPSGDKASLPYAEKFAETATYPTFYIKTKDGAVLTGSSWQTGGSVTAQNGYTVVTSTQYDAQKIEPGATRTIILTTTGTAEISNIESISMSRKATSSGEEFGMQAIYGAESGDMPVITTTKEEETTKTESTTSAGETTEKSTTEAQITTAAGTGTYNSWKTATTYRAGDIVTYQNKVYECIQGHTSHDGWKPTDPGVLGILWKERTDLVNVPATTTEGETGNQETTTEDNYTVNTALPQHTVTGYWHNFINKAGALKLGDVPSYYDIICVSFTGNTTTPGEVTFELDKDLCNALGGYTKAEFIQDIKNLKAKGQHVIISVGGAEGRIEINSDEAAQRFANGLINIIKEYGFEGVDIDLEGSAVAGVDYIAEALRTVHAAFDDNFIITMAPETYYIQADRLSANDITTSYLRLALKIKDILTVCHPQFYNSGGMNGYGGTIVNPGNADFLTSLSTLVIEAGLRPDQVAMGVPSTSDAGGGYVQPAVVKNAFYSMIQGTSSGSFTPPKAYPTFRGVMTWSINWDMTNNYEWGKAMAEAVHALNTEETTTKESGTTENQTTTNVAEATTEVQPLAKPLEVVGLTIVSQEGAKVSYTWGQSPEQIALGQTYNVYVDGKMYKNYPNAIQDTYTFTSNGTHEIKVTAVLNGYETDGQSVMVNITGVVQPIETTKPQETTTSPSGNAENLPSTILIGYYHTWSNDGNPFIKLRDVDKSWDVINISFAEPVSAGSTDGKMQFNVSGLTESYTKSDFKKDIKDLQAQGKKIVLSIGGYEGYFSLTSQAAVNQFVHDIQGIVDEYGFDGIDIDLEQSSVQFESGNDPDINNPKSPKIVNMINAIRTIVNNYGDDFILSWAPETFYVQLGYQFYGGINQYCDTRAGVYLPMINALRDVTSYVHVQLYNSAPMLGLDNQSYNMGTEEGIVAMCEMLLKGFYVNSYYTGVQSEATYFAPLRPDQVVIGVPSSVSAAGSGQISNEGLQNAFTELNDKYPGIRGIMTWSINWDSAQNGNSFAQTNANFLAQFRAEEPTTEEPTTETTYTVSVDGNTVMTAKAGEKYTLPRTARVGYYADGKMYKKGSSYTVTGNVNFSSVDLTANTGASIRLADPSGLTFKAAITCSDSTLFTGDAIVNEGMLITTNDIYSEEGALNLASEYTKLNIVNSGWNGTFGSFSGSIAGIQSMNYGRTYIARAYVTVKFADGTQSVLYSSMTGVRSVRSVATSMKNTPSIYNALTTSQKALIDAFAKTE